MGSTMIKRTLVLTPTLLLAQCWAAEFVNTEYNVLEGKPFTLRWKDANGPVEISLVNGETSNLETIKVIESGGTGNSYVWTPPDLLLAGTYAFAISDGGGKSYSPLWDYDYEENENASTSMSSTSPATASIITTASTTASTTEPLTTVAATAPRETTTASDASLATDSPASLKSILASSSSASASEHVSLGTLRTTSTPVASASSRSQGNSRPTDSSSNPNSDSGISSNGKQQIVSHGLSTGAKAGIGVGAGLGGLILVSAASLLVLRLRKTPGQRSVGYGNFQTRELKAELGGEPKPRAELGGQGLAEMHAGHDGWRGQPSELEAPR